METPLGEASKGLRQDKGIRFPLIPLDWFFRQRGRGILKKNFYQDFGCCRRRRGSVMA
jgi:hypothetical protein